MQRLLETCLRAGCMQMMLGVLDNEENALLESRLICNTN